jgi:hypothetical protein
MRYTTIFALMGVTILLAAGQAAAQTTGLPDTIREEVRNTRSLPRGRYVAVRTWAAAGREGAHQMGRAAADPQASEGKAWEARSGVDSSSAGMLLYGPYLDVTPGDYAAFFRIKLLEEAGEESVADVDATANYGQNILRVRELTGSDLSFGRYVQVPLAFHHPGGKLECRIAWRGYASMGVDRVSLFRLEGGSIQVPAERAKQPEPSGEPKNLVPVVEKRPFPDIFPRSAPPASTLLVFDLSKQPPDWQLALLCLQGLVNRSKPQLYCLFNPTDGQWLTWMKQRGWIKTTQTIAKKEDLLARYRHVLKGMVITDPQLPATKNIATMIAGVDNALVVSPRIAKTLNLPVLDDLRNRWPTSADAYRWAFDQLWPRLNHFVIACSWPDHLALRDYLVQNRVFIFWLSGPIDGARAFANPDVEVRLMEELLAKMPVNIPVMSYPWAGKDIGIGEGPGVTLFAEFGKYLVGSINCSNLSVHSGIPIKRLTQRRATPAPKPDRNKVYVSWVISDGDNLPVLTAGNFPQLWKDKTRGKFPIGWTVSPSAFMLIPDIVDYYYSTSTPDDDWLGAVSGIGYTYADSYAKRYRGPDRARIFDGFLDQTAAYMAKMGLTMLWPMNVTRPDLIARYAERITALQALFPDYGRRVTGYEEATYPTARAVPVFHALLNWAEGMPREEQIASIVRQVRAMTPAERPAFMHLFVLNWFADLPMLQEILKRLGPEYVCVRPDHLAALYRQELARQQLLVRAPSVIAGVEGQPVVFTATVHNVTAKPLDIRAALTGGLAGAAIKPDRARLAPGEALALTVTGTPSGERAELEIQGAFGARRRPLALRQVPLREIAGTLPPGVTLRFAGQFEAEDLPHRSGKAEDDPQASGGRVWAARRGDAEAGYVIYGPYAPFPAGRYVALFRLKRAGEGEGSVATLDTCVGGSSPITSSQEMFANELPLNAWRAVPMVFNHPGGALETRVIWSGRVPLAVDCVTLWEIEKR